MEQVLMVRAQRKIIRVCLRLGEMVQVAARAVEVVEDAPLRNKWRYK
jgi:hypothetical protein